MVDKLATILQTADLIHDLGNPPFGHYGETVFLNVDSIVYDVQNDNWYDNLYNDAMANKVIDIVLRDNPFVSLNIFRAMILRKQYGMNYSRKLAGLIIQEAGNDEKYVEKLLQIQDNRYGKALLGENDIKNEIDLAKIKAK